MHKFEITNAEGGAAFPVLVTPNAATNQITGKDEEAIYVDLTAASEREAVDHELIAFLAEELALGEEKIAIAAGKSVDKKVVIVMGLTPFEIERRLLG